MAILTARRLDRPAPKSVCGLLKLLAVIRWFVFSPVNPPRVIVLRRGGTKKIAQFFLVPPLLNTITHVTLNSRSCQISRNLIISQIFGRSDWTEICHYLSDFCGVIGAEICHYPSDFLGSDWGRNLSLSLRFLWSDWGRNLSLSLRFLGE